jgi:hypothetical protein
MAEDETGVTDYEDDEEPFRLGWRYRTVFLRQLDLELLAYCRRSPFQGGQRH